MNKSEIIRKVAKESKLSLNDASKAVDAFLVEISEALDAKSEVAIKDFGSFKVASRPERKGRNPQTGEIITIPEKIVVKFSPSKNIFRLKWL